MGDLLLVTGDSSADRYASQLVSYLKSQGFPGEIYAAAGPRTGEAEADLVANVVDRSVVGFSEITGSLPYFYNLLKDLDELVSSRPVDAVLLMDFPGFNLSFAWLSRVRELGIPLFYYITPQVWAWWRWRMKLLKKWFDELFVIFPFEEEIFREEGMNASFVGHPMLENRPEQPEYDVAETMDISPGKSIISFFPGSRDQEIDQHLDVMVETARNVDNASERYQPIFSAAATVNQQLFESAFERHGCEFPVWGGDSRSLLEGSSLSLLASGTITMEAAFAQTPMIVGYQTSWLTYQLGSLFFHLDHVAMPNLIHDEPFVPEYIQEEFTVEQLSEAVVDWASDRVRLNEQEEILGSMRDTFQRKNPTAEVGRRLLSVAGGTTRGH